MDPKDIASMLTDIHNNGRIISESKLSNALLGMGAFAAGALAPGFMPKDKPQQPQVQQNISPVAPKVSHEVDLKHPEKMTTDELNTQLDKILDKFNKEQEAKEKASMNMPSTELYHGERIPGKSVDGPPGSPLENVRSMLQREKGLTAPVRNIRR